MDVELRDRYWGPRVDQLRATTLPVLLERLETQGVVDNFRRLSGNAGPDAPRRAMHFSDSDLYKWVEAAVLAGALDLCDEVIDLIAAAAVPDGYVHTYYGIDGGPPRYSDLDFGHEHYCAGHLIEAAVAHHATTGSDRLLAVAVGVADHLCATFGPGRDERTDAHPEIELALCRLAEVTGTARYVEHAAWIVEAQLRAAGTTLDGFGLGGHAVRALYLSSGIAEVALATGDPRWVATAQRLFDSMVAEHAYPTGAVGGRWLGEAVGMPFEQPDAMAYAESCAAVAATQFSRRMWHLTGDLRALDQIELLLCNAVACGVGAEGDTWFYSQPQAVAAAAEDPNPWVYEFDYGQLMLRQWFPARRHRWFDVPCCPPNLARAFAAVPGHVAEVDAHGDLLVHLPLDSRIHGDGWDVHIDGGYPEGGALSVRVRAAPAGRRVLVRRPGWAGGGGHRAPASDGRVEIPLGWEWWATDHRVEGAAGTVHLRRGPVVYCVEGVDHPGLDLRDLVVDPSAPPESAFSRRSPPAAGLHHPVAAPPTNGSTGPRPDPPGPQPQPEPEPEPVAVTVVPYRDWANRGTTTMRIRFPVRPSHP